MWEMPTGVMLFNDIVTNNSTLQVNYVLQLQEQPYGPISNLNGSQSQMYPNNTVEESEFRLTNYISYISSSLLSIGLNLTESEKQIEILASTESLLQLHWPYIYPAEAVGGCSTIPFALGFLLPVFVYLLVLEKKEKHLEMMRIMGLSKSTYWIVNFIFNYCLYLVVLLIVLVLGLIFQITVFYKTNPVVYIILFLLWGFQQNSLAFLFSSLFSEPKAASVVSYMFVFLGLGIAYQISLFIIGPYSTGALYYLLLFVFPPFPFVRGVYLLEHPFFTPQFFSPLDFSTLYDFNSDIMVCFYFLILTSVIYLILTLYFDQVMPRSYGIRKHPLFPIFAVVDLVKKLIGKKTSELEKEKESYDESHVGGEEETLIGNEKRSESTEKGIKGVLHAANDEGCIMEERNAHNPNFQALLRIVDMHKMYKIPRKPSKVALKKLNLTINAKECFALLGPNGAGKTTLQSILCGLISPTSGYAMLDGHQIPNETDAIYTMVGYCPQYDVLWGDLTVQEHLLFYCRLKSISSKFEKEYVKQLAARVNLEPHLLKRTSELSGGMKRCLSVGISLIGDPLFVLLDEPSTGVDPVARRAIWEILSREKEGRAIILTTHNMQEAEVLSNRIGIMAQGKLLCVGTQSHLKKKYGSGFTLQVTTNNAHATQKYIQLLYPTASLDTSISGILCYRIPQDVPMDLGALFNAMKLKHEHGIIEWGVNQTTLEEVFIRTVEMEEAAIA